jgi:O-antigen/teichoic acid export membrane protein
MNWRHNPLLKTGLISTIARFAGVGLNFAVAILLTRTLPMDEAGMVFMLMTLVTGVALFSRLGVEQWVVREVARLSVSEQSQQIHYLKAAYALTLRSSLLFMLAWLLVSPMMQRWLFDGSIRLEFLGIAVLGIPAFNIIMLNSTFLKSVQKTADSILVQNSLPAISYMLVLVLAWFYYRYQQHYLLFYTLSLILAAITSFYWLKPWWQTLKYKQSTAFALKTVLNQSLVLAPVSFFSFLMLWADTLLTGWLLTNADVALFTVAARLSFISLFFLGALDATIYPRLLNIHKHNPSQLKSFFWQSTGLVAGVLSGVTFLLLIAGELILTVFKPEYVAASTTLALLLIAQLIRALSLTFSFMFIMENQVRYLNSLLGFALVINILANLFLIPRFGIEGAASATLSANFVLTAGVIWLFFKNHLLNLSKQTQ